MKKYYFRWRKSFSFIIWTKLTCTLNNNTCGSTILRGRTRCECTNSVYTSIKYSKKEPILATYTCVIFNFIFVHFSVFRSSKIQITTRFLNGIPCALCFVCADSMKTKVVVVVAHGRNINELVHVCLYVCQKP